jgi:hypothetical protein
MLDYDGGKGQLSLMPPTIQLSSEQLSPISLVASAAPG